MKRNSYRTALLISASAALAVLASNPSTRTAAPAAADVGVALAAPAGTLQAGPTLSPPSLTFASQIVGTTSGPQVVTLTNSRGAPLRLPGLSALSVGFGNNSDFAQTNNSGSSLAAS